ncbi:YqhA family protein [Neorhizobium sp. T786]|uniref:YqhA family protein n=1 Tax=Pseudorhizobium xiangyangii TaxID=2883104 RepID=UPI001D000835|nr:YqhA family protein [Neorhizobium xiangyangii]MCB5201141.1 YqhA family protein [Neorhizobium xiangyangii]
MVSFFLGLRYFLILASLGVLFAAFLMFWEGLLMLWEGYGLVRLDPDFSVIVTVLQATDKILLGIVLMVVGCGIALGFALDISPEQRKNLPQWMIIDTVAELKNLFFQMIILYLVVHFAAQVGETQGPLDWNTLVLPLSVLLLGGAMKLVASSSHLPEQRRENGRDDHRAD